MRMKIIEYCRSNKKRILSVLAVDVVIFIMLFGKDQIHLYSIIFAVLSVYYSYLWIKYEM